jgi:hypothetical protein
MSEPFVSIPRRFYAAHQRGDLNGRQFLLGCYLAGAIDFRTGEVALTTRALEDGIGWEWSRDTLLRDLKKLRADWIDFETKQGQRERHVFRLTGLRVGDDEGSLPPDFRTANPSPAEVTSDVRKLEQDATPQPEGDPDPSQSPQCGSPKKRREEKRRKNVLEGETYDQAQGKGTAKELSGDGFLEVLQSLNGGPPVHVVAGDDGKLEWSQPPREGEAGVVADFQGLVDAGIASWVEPT